ncbi:MAG TPA: proline--tRNA ligase [Actinomycetota bacterium]|nr:proline--tRNA ligase [Actinomycetota bacterium]
MRLSQLFARTLREDPAEAEVASHRLLLRAAFIRRTAAGIYTAMPLGFRTMRKIERVVREEMDAAGSQELRMPIVLPAEPWRTTGRYDAYGDLMFRLRDRHEREFILGPTQEEVVAELAQQELPSYRDLPANVYQVEWKYRDEFRPRYGLLRGREFLMKDAYSLDRDEDGMRASYQVMYDAYVKIFDRLGLDHVIVEADPGQIGGGVNHEFMALADVGEDLFVRCENADYLADTEAATPRPPEPVTGEELEPLTEVETPGAVTIDLMVEQMGLPAEATMKCILFDVEGRTVAVLVPGDREINEEKLARLHFPHRVRPFADEDFAERGFAKGFVGPQGLGPHVTIFADPSIRGRANWATGANRPDVHVTGANLDRDFRVDRWEDLVQFREGDRCPLDGGELRIERSIVVGHIYQLGTNYSGPLQATFQDEDGTQQPYVMGSYGIGITRIMAAVVEQNHDDAGIRWPRGLAPYEVVVIMANADEPTVTSEAERIYAELTERGVETTLDDRAERAGVKFADADLVGYPVQVVVGTRGLRDGTVDLKLRASGERRSAALADAASAAAELLDQAP